MASMRGSETQEQTLERLEQNRTRMASMRASETSHVKLHKFFFYRKNKEAMANARTRTVPVEGAIAAFHSEVKLGPCTSVLRIVLHDINIKRYTLRYYTQYLELPTRAHLLTLGAHARSEGVFILREKSIT